jgi:CPA2 family monovalent cation:H+ antiporter-2
MPHETGLIATIVAAFALAFVFGLIARQLKLSPIVGYLIAGILIGPFTPGYVADTSLASQLAEIGVILLMFGVGLHFSLADLMRVRAIAVPGAIGQIAVATCIGAAIALLWGWTLSSAMVFGLALSVASTVVLLRALEDYSLLRTHRGQIAIGWLIVEDLAMVVALVLLPAFASIVNSGGAGFSAWQLVTTLAITIGKVVLFVVLMFAFGRRWIPKLLGSVAAIRSRELFTLAVLAIAMGVAYASSLLFGVSLALGAFFAGVVLNESELSHKAAEDILPLQDAFAVLFFVSVGMLYDPHTLFQQPLQVIAVTLVIVLGKSLAALIIVLAYGHSLRTALTAAVSLAQIGEFSFILIGLALSLGLVTHEAQTLILAGAILSIAINPFMFRLIEPAERWSARHPRSRGWLSRPDSDTDIVVPTDWSNHVVIVGHGRVGRVIAEMLREHDQKYAVVETNRAIVESLAQQGIPALVGDMADPQVMRAVALQRARLLAFAIPDSFQLRHALDQVRKINPKLEVIARTHDEASAELLRNSGVALVVMGERELARQMGRYAVNASVPSDTPATIQTSTSDAS